ncbi:MAG: hypothetical protein RLZZ440_2915 [Planctomycetota bacterium]
MPSLAEPVSFTCVHADWTKEAIRVKAIRRAMLRQLAARDRSATARIHEMTYEQLPDEWKEWLSLSPLERFARGEQMLVEYIAMGGSLDPDPDPTSPFDIPEEWRPDVAHGRAGLRLLRRGAG